MSHCPHDQEMLASNDVSGYRYYSCERCSGDWIPGVILDRALSARGVQELRDIPSSGHSKLTCPDCRTTLATLVVDDCTLDSCHRCHGIWLDAGEALRVQRLFPEGSAVVDADAGRAAREADKGWAAVSLVDCVANLILLIGK